jgi:undecaprenyl diphosphate synthase
MIQRTSAYSTHLAIILDGNGRWAAARNLPRLSGHLAGVAAIRRTLDAVSRLPVSTLTLYAFSSDNWRRPRQEVDALMQLFHDYLLSETDACQSNGIRVSVIGRRDRLPRFLRPVIDIAERATSSGDRLHLRIAVDYSSRDQILAAAGGAQAMTRDEFSRSLGPDVDLLIRTGGEQRLSDFLLWECAYAELYFTPVMWPDFQESHLQAAWEQFLSRERRFGGLAA